MFDEELGFMKLQAQDICEFKFLPIGTKFQPIALNGHPRLIVKTSEYGGFEEKILLQYLCDSSTLVKVFDLPIEYLVLSWDEAWKFTLNRQSWGLGEKQ
jgi:hypothetical protein